MTVTENKPISRGDYSEGISIETSKVIQGMSLVFSGAMTMLEAIHPKISLEPAELMCLMTGDKEGLRQIAEMRKAEAAEEVKEAEATEKSATTEMPKEETNETENANVGATDGVSASVPDASLDDAPDKQVTETKEPAKAVESTTTTLTQDDITKVIVQKIKHNRSNNEKIGQLLKTHGVSKVSELPASKYEAFLTDLSAI